MPAAALTWDGPLAVITFDVPPLNLFGPDTVADIRAALAEINASPEARGVLFRANGKAVSAASTCTTSRTTPQSPAQRCGDWFTMIHAIESLPMPTVFAAHGLCLTAAFEISLACDILLAAEAASSVWSRSSSG